jgi:hypothetical protein
MMISEWIYGYEFHIEKAMFSDWNPELTSCLVDCHVYPCSFQMATIQPPSCLVQWFTSYLNGDFQWHTFKLTEAKSSSDTHRWIPEWTFQTNDGNNKSHGLIGIYSNSLASTIASYPTKVYPLLKGHYAKAEPIRLCHFWPYFRRSTPPQLTYLTYTLPNVGGWKIMFNSK